MDMTDTSNLEALRTELNVWRALETVVREPVAVYAPVVGRRLDERALLAAPARSGRGAQRALHRARLLVGVKNVFAVDPDIDIFSDGRWNGRSAPAISPTATLWSITGVRAFRSIPRCTAPRPAPRRDTT